METSVTSGGPAQPENDNPDSGGQPEDENRPNRHFRRHPEDDGHRLLSPAELGDLWGITRQHVYSLMREGLPSVTLGRCRRIRLADAELWLDGRNAA